MDRRTPVFIVCSPLPRVGKTLVARLLVEFFVADERPVAAFDLNPDGYALAAQAPENAVDDRAMVRPLSPAFAVRRQEGSDRS